MFNFIFYLSISRVIKLLNQLHHGALAASTGSHNAHCLTSTHCKVNTFQNLHNNTRSHDMTHDHAERLCNILLYLNILSSWVGKGNILEFNCRYQFLQFLSTLGARVYWWRLRKKKKSHDIHEHITIHRFTADANIGIPQFINVQL